MVDLFRFKKWDMVSKRGIYYLISLVMVTIGLLAMGANYSRTKELFKLGIDFKGGGLVTYRLDGSLPAGKGTVVAHDIREQLSAAGIENEVQVSPGSTADVGDSIIVRTMLQEGGGQSDDQALVDVLAGQITDTITPTLTKVVKQHAPELSAPVEDGREVVTGTVSEELVNNSILAFTIGSLLILGWIWLRYNIAGFGLRYSLAGLLALFHDLLILLGVFAVFAYFDLPFTVNSPFIAALLTVLGYSIHDTIIIFDRIRENIRLRKGRTFAETVNISILETLARSVNTVLTVLFTLLALFIFGGPTLRDFVAAMLIGVAAGAYSSIFLASQFLVSWSKKEEQVILPRDAQVPAMATASAAPSVAIASTPTAKVEAPMMAAQPPVATPDAVRRARQAGKTAKRRR